MRNKIVKKNHKIVSRSEGLGPKKIGKKSFCEINVQKIGEKNR